MLFACFWHCGRAADCRKSPRILGQMNAAAGRGVFKSLLKSQIPRNWAERDEPDLWQQCEPRLHLHGRGRSHEPGQHAERACQQPRLHAGLHERPRAQQRDLFESRLRISAGAREIIVTPTRVPHLTDDGEERRRPRRDRKYVKNVRAMSAVQQRLLDAIDECSVVAALGPAGTGKTCLAIAKAMEALEQNKVGRIVLCLPAVEAGESPGFLPTPTSCATPWWRAC